MKLVYNKSGDDEDNDNKTNEHEYKLGFYNEKIEYIHDDKTYTEITQNMLDKYLNSKNIDTPFDDIDTSMYNQVNSMKNTLILAKMLRIRSVNTVNTVIQNKNIVKHAAYIWRLMKAFSTKVYTDVLDKDIINKENLDNIRALYRIRIEKQAKSTSQIIDSEWPHIEGLFKDMEIVIKLWEYINTNKSKE